jgi:ATP-dependent DNA helicase RecG
MNKLLENILQIPAETLHVEFKRLGEAKVVEKIVRTITAFANTDGGTLILGIDDPEKTKLKGLERIYGIEENLEIFDAIGHEISKIIPPLVGVWPPQKIDLPELGKTVALVFVPKAEQAFHAIHNQVFIRLEKGNKRLTPQEIIKFSYAKGFEKADRELVDVDFELLDTDVYKLWKEHREIKEAEISKTLLNVGLARKNEEQIIQPTRAAVMLFCDHPTNLMETKCCNSSRLSH